MVELFDTHCHIQMAGLPSADDDHTRKLWVKLPDATGDTLVRDAAAAGVTRLMVVGCDVPDSQLAVDFVQKHDQCWASIGIHPHEAQEYQDDAASWQTFAALATQPKVKAVGECGLDYFYEHSPKEAQLPMLRRQIELALEHDLPLIFHVREAFDDFWPIFDDYQGIRGVLHSFTDTQANLDKALERGLFIGVNGIATFAKSPDLAAVHRAIPLQKLLLETDAPYLTPHPYRGSINEPKRVGTISEYVAHLRNEDPDLLSKATTDNARSLFGI